MASAGFSSTKYLCIVASRSQNIGRGWLKFVAKNSIRVLFVYTTIATLFPGQWILCAHRPWNWTDEDKDDFNYKEFFPKNVLHFKGLTSAIWRQLDTKTSKVLESYFLKLNLLLNLMELILYYLLLYLKKRLLQEYISICVIYDFIVRIIWRDLQIIICFMRGGKHKLLS